MGKYFCFSLAASVSGVGYMMRMGVEDGISGIEYIGEWLYLIY